VRIAIGLDRIGVRAGACSVDGALGIFRGRALVCPRCGRILGGI
jgi:hypothetical protein